MKLGMVGLGRMGLNMSLRLLRAGQGVVAHDRSRAPVDEAAAQGAKPAYALEDVAKTLEPPRVVWLMIPSGAPVDETIAHLTPTLASGDLIVDGGNSNWHDSRRRATALETSGVGFVDCGTSGGIWGLERGYCMMLGGGDEWIERLSPALDALAPPEGWLHVGPSGSGHFAKMIHNGIE